MSSLSLTPAQKRIMKMLSGGKTATYSPGESVSLGNITLSRRPLRKLLEAGLVEELNIYPYGSFPVYGISLSDEGKKYLELLEGK